MLAQPWWVNLLVLAPPVSYLIFRNRRLAIGRSALAGAFIFGLAFGFVEAAVVVYLRLATTILPWSKFLGLQAGVPAIPEPTVQILNSAPEKLIMVEVLREAATMVMLLSVAFLGARKLAERSALFLWTFAIWDIAYYAGLRALIHWPASLRSVDVLFLIPVPWISEVWFPLAVSVLTLAAILAANRWGPSANGAVREKVE